MIPGKIYKLVFLTLISISGFISLDVSGYQIDYDGEFQSYMTKLQPDLLDFIFNQSLSSTLIPVTIVMQEQVSQEQIQRARLLSDKAEKRSYVTGLLKELAEETQAGLLEYLHIQQAGGKVGNDIRPLWIHNLISTTAPPEIIYEIAERDDVAYINYDQPMGIEILPVLPAFDEDDDKDVIASTIECGVDLMDADRVWNEFGITGRGVVVGVIDTGLCITHPDIQNQVWNNPDEIPDNGIDDDNNGYIDDIHGWSFSDNNNYIDDYHGHGSHVSGTIAGDGTGGQQSGMAPDANIQILKFWDDFTAEPIIWEAMQYAADNGTDVISASLGWHHDYNPDRATWRTVCENTIAAGVVVVYAAHNFSCSNPPDDITTPGDVPDVITVGATDCNDIKATFSSCGPTTWEGILPWDDWPYPPGKIKPTIAAPGVNTVSHYLCADYIALSGTSMSTPHIAGAVALMLEADPSLDHYQVKQILMDTAVDLGAPGMDNFYGAGRASAYEAVLAALGGSGGHFDLQITGLCPGILFAKTVRSNPGDRVAYAYGYALGSAEVPPCPGMTADLLNPVLIKVLKADENGETRIHTQVWLGICGKVFVQAFNLDLCAKSQVIGI